MVDNAMATVAQVPGSAMTDDQRTRFERDGYLVLPSVLDPEELGRYTSIVDTLYEQRKRAGLLAGDGSLHELSAVARCPELAPLVDHPKVLGLVWSTLGWNVHVYHSHVDVHPRVPTDKPYRFEWHQDGGRQNVELETDPRPRMSVKVAYWLSDVSQPGRGNFKVVPGSHRTNRIDGPPRRDVRWPDPPGAIQVTVQPGDAVFFDRRLWHSRSENRSTIVRKAVFFGYTYRWIHIRDTAPAMVTELTPLRQQLLGLLRGVDGDHAWGHDPDSVPLYRLLHESAASST
jgi:ectoine hydroxylase